MQFTTRRPCAKCPFMKASAQVGFTGPYSVQELHEEASHGPAYPCHIYQGGTKEDHCIGIQLYRSSICSSPRDPMVNAHRKVVTEKFGTEGTFKLGELHKFHEGAK